MSNVTRYFGAPALGPSPIIFGDLSKHVQNEYMGKCMVVWDTFASLGEQASAAGGGRYTTYQNTGVTIAQGNTVADLGEALGVLVVAGNDADNDQGFIQFGGGKGDFRIDNGSGNTGKVMFEARVQSNSIANNGVAFFVGLGTGPLADADLADDTGDLVATKGYIGFSRLADDGAHVDIVYQGASQTKQILVANALTMVADTWYRLGFVYDPDVVDSKKVTFYIDGVEQSTYVTTTLLDTATFPEGESLSPMLLTKVGTAAEATVSLDYVAAVQYADGEDG
jgi:hypothetical protein